VPADPAARGARARPHQLHLRQPAGPETALHRRRTGRALGLTIPQSVLLRADEVIQ